MIREIVLSGFQLELYLGGDIPFAYWYSAQVIDEHLKYLHNISSTVLHGGFGRFLLNPSQRFPLTGSEAFSEMRFLTKFLTLLQLLCTSLFLVCLFAAEMSVFMTPSCLGHYLYDLRQG